jgi:hypothetical protein
MASKFFSTRVVPVCSTSAVANNSVLFVSSEVPTGVRNGQSVMLKSITVIDAEDELENIELLFFRKRRNAAGTEVGLTTLSGAVDITAANLVSLEPIGSVMLDLDGTGANGFTATEKMDLINAGVHTRTDINLIMTSHPSESNDEPLAEEGCIYMAGVNRGSGSIGLTSASAYTFVLGFELSA